MFFWNVLRGSMVMMFLCVLCTSVFADSTLLVGQASVIDGDTIEIRGQRVRFHGVDAFESSQTCGDNAWSCGRQAAFYLDELIAGRNVTCEIRDVDRYQRGIGVCSVDSIDLNGSLVRAGLALAYRQYSKDYVPLENLARTEGAGAWSGSFVAPWDFRRHR